MVDKKESKKITEKKLPEKKVVEKKTQAKSVAKKRSEKKPVEKKVSAGAIVENITFKDLKFSKEDSPAVSKDVYSSAIRVLRQNWRQGTVACKGRSDVVGSTKKPWKQKGTGRARAGTVKSPLWRGGGVTFGPQERSKKLKLPQKIRQSVCRTILCDKLDAKSVMSLDWAVNEKAPRTSDAFKLLKKIGLLNKKILFFVTFDDYATQMSFRNIPNVSMLAFDQPNAYVLSNGDYWVFLKRDINLFKEMVGVWT